MDSLILERTIVRKYPFYTLPLTLIHFLQTRSQEFRLSLTPPGHPTVPATTSHSLNGLSPILNTDYWKMESVPGP